ncbi:MAG: sigma-54 factor interaction domain-containing protein, partial [Planctomycetes bacterium]|nr:sigma-54 factor interaction domain-containing protein [Planctomycetota bacterium]
MSPPVIHGSDPRFLACLSLVERGARAGLKLLVEGETGTGKELVARLAHCLGPYRAGPFVPVNCGCIDRTLARSDLIGHEKGAFTGAVERRPGAFDRSQGGTLFLDEIGDLPLDVQPE